LQRHVPAVVAAKVAALHVLHKEEVEGVLLHHIRNIKL
jgi:hypothetical protein